jgi:hypothetical protein
MLLAVWLPTALFSLLHYSTGVDVHWLHDVLRRMYYLPIILAAFSCGFRGGMLLAVVVAVLHAPHAFTHWIRIDPADQARIATRGPVPAHQTYRPSRGSAAPAGRRISARH